MARGSNEAHPGGFWNSAWHWKGPQRIRVFLWLALRHRLLTNEERQRRHLANSANCDRCVGLGVTSSCGLIRNDQGRWIRGFAYNIGSCSVPCAELWALLEGIKLAWTLGIRSLQIECDSLLVVNMVKDDALLHNSLRPLVFLIKRFLSLEWQCELTHVYREANFSADYLMNYVASFPIGLHILEAPPPGVLHWLLHDSSG
ncbi:hypothetical protein P3X46_007442 [Hevea brasiliensis]|uniref:RNase H type-1 domain-containing protein n=1 Tax=Hevea brasiliensis TaxID=3981 RepID=A0ABQ9MTI7_HEVBR|nr:hypothetical protein P3X46_007442 [Hevea brasiliensis]